MDCVVHHGIGYLITPLAGCLPDMEAQEQPTPEGHHQQQQRHREDNPPNQHEEVSSRHPLVALPFSAILRFTGAWRRRGPTAGRRGATTVTGPASAVADRRGLYALLAAEGVSQIGNTMTIVAGPWFVLEITGSLLRCAPAVMN
jgi:hypothetical protein